MITFRTVLFALGSALAAASAAPATGASFIDPLDAPAMQSPLAARSMLQGVTKAGSRLVAVGQRGHVVYSADNGASWKQASVPVSSDMTAVFFRISVCESGPWAAGGAGGVPGSGTVTSFGAGMVGTSFPTARGVRRRPRS